ncbi:MAG: iron-siderophore ABC transporter substrate-binding protein [Chloroflexi bacterium]|nr:iron-siderophore ABC transporter substrate-binding protein [Chloroflexota bacterium]
MPTPHIQRTLIALLIGILLVACGSPAATTTDQTGTSATAAASTAPEASASPATSPDASAPAESATETSSSGDRVVKHAMGETTVPANPQRVVVLDTGELDTALALGVKPVGAVSASQGGSFPAYLADRTEGITNVGTIQQPNLEAIIALKPDLILSSKLRHEAIYPQLSQIAPTVFTEAVGVVWKENLMLHAEALGKTTEAQKLMDDYTARLDEFKTKMGDRLANTKVSTVRFLSGGKVRIYMKQSFIGTVLQDAGLPRPPAQDKDVFAEEVSKERIPEMDGDVMFVTTFGAGEETALATFQSDPLWSQLGVVKANKVYPVSDDYWMLGIGMLAANRVIDDLFTHLAQG